MSAQLSLDFDGGSFVAFCDCSDTGPHRLDCEEFARPLAVMLGRERSEAWFAREQAMAATVTP